MRTISHADLARLGEALKRGDITLKEFNDRSKDSEINIREYDEHDENKEKN